MPRKPVIEKLKTRIMRIIEIDGFHESGNKVKYGNKVFFQYTNDMIKYNKWRYRKDNVNPLYEEDLIVTLLLSGENFDALGTDIINPPYSCGTIASIFEKLTENSVKNMVIGTNENKYENSTLSIRYDNYCLLKEVLKQEKDEKNNRVKSRLSVLFAQLFHIRTSTVESSFDYSMMLKEIIESGNYDQNDIIALANKIEGGVRNTVVIENQIRKQTEWLISCVQSIVDTTGLNKEKAQRLGNSYFGYERTSIKGPEHLMEKILSDYGKNTFFGAPYLINTDKYVMSSRIPSKSQFDILLINQFNDIEIVELKRPDAYVLEYDSGRNKFYASKDLSIAISQIERYLTSIIHDNDEEFKIKDKKIREFLNDEIGGQMSVDIIRPTGLVVIGSYQTITKPYETIDFTRSRVKKSDYEKNSELAFRELKRAYKNMEIMTYSELIENARLRLL